MSELPNIPGRPLRVLVGDSVFEDAAVTLNEGRLSIEFEADDLPNVAIDFRELVGDVERIAELFDGIGHPVRLRILITIGNHDGALSPNGITKMLDGVTIGTVAYHVRTMVKSGLLQLAREAKVRGAVEHFYKLTPEGVALLARVTSV